MLFRHFLIATLAAAVPAIVWAQTAAAPPPSPPAANPQDDVVVRGRTDSERKAIQTYVANISVRSESQLARFHQPVCPIVIGFDRPYAAIVEKRIRADAVAARVPVDRKAKCSANLIVIMTENGSELLKDIRVHKAEWLGDLAPSEIDALIAPAPARAWSVTSLRNEDGDRQHGGVLNVVTASILRQPTRQDVEASFVVIDKKPSLGLKLGQIADYAAMRGLAHTRPPKPGGSIDTILAVFDASAPPVRALTDSDTAYLRALYASNGTMTAVDERNAITRRIAKGK